MKVIIKALKATLTDGNRHFPIFLGYLPAEELAQISEVPSFTTSNSNADIARNVLNPPIKDWQRPLIEEKWQRIRDKFSKPNELMPNPVLLAVHDGARVKVQQQSLHGQLTEIFEIHVDADSASNDRPLWILDGQHRVKGMSESSQKQNAIPLVLLHGEAAQMYSPAQFARVFAEVTTYATPLEPIHEDWLRFAFKLGTYEPGAGGSDTPTWKAMAAIAELCELQTIGSGMESNPFHSKIQFNPQLPLMPAVAEGFAYSSLLLKELVLEHYYAQPHANLTPRDLAVELARAVLALVRTDPTQTTASAFFGDAKHRQRYLQDAFIIGICNHLRAHGVPSSWDDVLTGLQFSNSQWDVTGWVVSTGGNSGNTSKAVATSVLANAFAEQAIPLGAATIPDLLAGDAAHITFRASQLTAKGRAAKHGFLDQTHLVNGNKMLNIGARRHLRLVGRSLNIGRLDIVDLSEPHGRTFTASSLKRGVVLPNSPGTVRLDVKAEYYGQTQSELKLTVQWT